MKLIGNSEFEDRRRKQDIDNESKAMCKTSLVTDKPAMMIQICFKPRAPTQRQKIAKQP